MGMDFNPDQKNWLEGFASGLGAMKSIGRAPAGLPSEPTGPDAEQLKAQDRQVAAGKKLVEQEKWKRTEHPFESYDRLKADALTGARPSRRIISAGATTACSTWRPRRTATCAACGSRTASSRTGSSPASRISPTATAAATPM